MGTLFLFLIAIYLFSAIKTSRERKPWPLYRNMLWVLGVLFAALAMIGPIAKLAHANFTAHMLVHLFLGMLAPLLMVLSAPVTLIFRSIHVNTARRLSRILISRPIGLLSDPIIAAFLNIGGLWLLYATGLYAEMQQNLSLHFLIHIHIFLAGYLFTMSIIYIDPVRHRTPFAYRAIILIMASAAHAILSKYIYATPPDGVTSTQAKMGGMLMYYGGDAIHLMLIFLLCLQWFKASRPRTEIEVYS